MALSSSPRKHIVPLATGDEPRPRTSSLNPTVTRRAFYCGVVVEGSENGRRLPEEIQDLVLSLGNPLPSGSSAISEHEQYSPSSSTSSLNDIDRAAQKKRALVDQSVLASNINELITSERSYVKRLQILKHDYADPLRNFARSKDTAIIPPYEAKTLFGNIDNLLPVNEAFLTDLEKMSAPNGFKAVGGVGDVALRHFKELKGFEQYKQYYGKREEAQSIFEKEYQKRSSRFASYIDHIKYQSTDPKNRIGLRELIMEPVQRIPRYTLLFKQMIRHMSADDPQRVKLLEADEIASKIALAEMDEHTKRASIFFSLTSAIDGFPPELFSHSRRFIDCIDVQDVITDVPGPLSASSNNLSGTVLHCTLFLFDDKLLIAKRPGNGDKDGRTLSGLDIVDKVNKAGGIPTGTKKRGVMTCKGVMDITDIAVTDIGGPDINLFMENPPQDQTERWSGRPFRSLSVVVPPLPINFDRVQTEYEKRRFLDNLWKAQANYRARAGQSVVLCADEQEVECRSGRTTYAQTYYNVYQRTAFLQEPKKTKVVVHIDRDRYASADPLPFGQGGPPFVVIRVQLMEGGLCRYSVSSSDPNDEGEEDIVQTSRIPARVIQTIHAFGLFEFKTGKNSVPSTPTAKSKVAIFGLDAISRNLFHGRPASAMGDFFTGSINGHRRMRSKSTASRSSMYTQTTTTMDSMKSSQRSHSTATAATTMSTMDEDSSYYASRSSKGKKHSRPLSTGDSPPESDRGGSLRMRSGSMSRPQSQSPSRGLEQDYSDGDDDDITILAKSKDIGTSDIHLAQQLELARQNSLLQHGKQLVAMQMDKAIEATIYEEEPPYPLRPASRTSASGSRTPSRSRESSPTTTRPSFHQSTDRRPIGPRSPSPLPPTIPRPNSRQSLPPMDDNHSLESPFGQHARHSSSSSQDNTSMSGTRSGKRLPLFPTSTGDSTSKSLAVSGSMSLAAPIEPLSIKKKTSVRGNISSTSSPTPVKKVHTRNAPHNRTMQRVASPRRVSPQIRKLVTGSSAIKSEDLEQIHSSFAVTKEQIESSRKGIKRLKSQVDLVRATLLGSNEESSPRPSSPDKGSRAVPINTPLTKAAQERLEEMRSVIGRRQNEVIPRTRPRSGTLDTPVKITASNESLNLVRTVEGLAVEIDSNIASAQTSHLALQAGLIRLMAEFKDQTAELARMRLEQQNSRRQFELFKTLLADSDAEKDIMYDAFNEELDAMYNDAHLPEVEAWEAMSRDLREAKEARNNLNRENSSLKRKLAETESEKEEWGEILRSHGLVP